MSEKFWVVVLIAGMGIGFLIGGVWVQAHDTPTSESIVGEFEDNGQDGVTAFEIYTGQERPHYWEFPVTVEFERPELNNYTQTYVARVHQGERFVANLAIDQRYRVTVTDANDNERVLGWYTATEGDAPVEIILFPCCSDY